MNNIISKIKNLEIQTLENIRASKAKNTIRAYKSDFNDFEKFCSELSLKSMPAEPRTVSLYLTHLSNNCKLSTIKRRLASIKVFHNLKSKYIDLKHPLISENLQSIKKIIGSFQKAKKPINTNELKMIISSIDSEKKIRDKVRNKALLLTGFGGAFRRSELVSILLEDLDFTDEGVKIFIKKSKTDQSGEGMIKALPYLSNVEFCPVLSLKKWIEYLENHEPNEKLLFNMSDKNVSLIIKKYISKIGLNKYNYSGHSLRSGFATSTAESGAEERDIMSITGHKSHQMVRRYIQQSNLFKNSALKKLKI